MYIICCHFSLSDHFEFEVDIDDSYIEEPFCDATYGKEAEILDQLDGVANIGRLHYTSENGLKDVLLTMSGEKEPLEVVGTRISRALDKVFIH